VPASFSGSSSEHDVTDAFSVEWETKERFVAHIGTTGVENVGLGVAELCVSFTEHTVISFRIRKENMNLKYYFLGCKSV
jgi:hypothetical protein